METNEMHKACYTCRRRHVECDRSQPRCLKCQKAGLICHEKRPLRWVQGVAIRGSMRGRLYQDSSVSSAPVALIEMHSTLPAQGPAMRNAQPRAQDFSPLAQANAALPSVPLSIHDPSLSALDPAARYYLDYYSDRICELFIVYDSENNPFRRLISLALSDGVLLGALLALAARHKANFDYPFCTSGAANVAASVDAHRDALRFKYRAIQGLSSVLNGQHPYQDVTVASIFLLVFLDLLESGCDRWNYHLEGAKSLVTLAAPNDPGRSVQRIRQFITKQIHLIEALGATFVRPQLLSKSTSIDESANLLEDVVEESFLGCPEYLLTAVQFFSLQRDIIANGDPSDRASAHDVDSVLDTVKLFDCYSWASALPQESVTRDIDGLCKLSRAYQLGAILYGQRVRDAVKNEETHHEPVVCELIGVINSLKDGSNLLKCILWPITVAGLEAQTQCQKDLLLLALEKFWISTKCFNVMNAAKILQAYWKKVDENKAVVSRWIFDIGRLSHDWLLI